MAKAKKKKKKSSGGSPSEILSRVDVRTVRVVMGFVLAALAVGTVAALISYLFTWSADQSLLTDPDLFRGAVKAENVFGAVGLVWARFLISEVFGIGAFFIPILFGALAVLCFRISKVNLLRVFVVCTLGSIFFSLFGSYIASFFEGDAGSVLGARWSCGGVANRWLCSVIGEFGAGMLYFIFIILWSSLLTKKVVYWFDDLFYNISHKPEKVEEVPDEEDEYEDEDEGDEIEPEPVRQTPGVPDLSDKEDPGEDEEFIELSLDDDRNGKGGSESPDGGGVRFSIEGDSPDDPDGLTVMDDDNPSGDDSDADESNEPKVTDVPIDVEPDENAGGGESDAGFDHNYDPRLDLPNYKMPPVSLLEDYSDKLFSVSRDELEKNKDRIVNALANYKIKVVGITAKMGPTVTLYKIHLASGVTIAQVRTREEDIAISLGSKGVRVVTLVDCVGIEVPNERPSVVPLKSVLCNPQMQTGKMELPLAVGITVTNEPFIIDLAKMPHLLVAGATGMGKSVGLNCIINSLLYAKHPAEVKFVMVDPKKVELSLYNKLEKHFLAKLPDEEEAIITDTKKVVRTLKSLCQEMESRYDLLKIADVRAIKDYNEKFLQRKLNPQNGHKFLPYIVVIVDEFADLLSTAGREVEEPIARLAQKARAVGIHLVIATQRPTTDVITGTIKANFNSRISFKVMSMVDSKTIIDATGANKLIGRGDMLVIYPGAELTRVQCALIDTEEIKSICKFINDQRGYFEPFYLPEPPEEGDGDSSSSFSAGDLHRRDALFEEAAKIVVEYRSGSTSLLQRKLKIGYNRAGSLIDELSAAGVVGPANGSKARDVLITDLDTLDRLFDAMDHI